MLEEKQNTSGRLAIVDNLIAVAKADTLYCDLYLLRAGYYLQPEMTKENYRNLEAGADYSNQPAKPDSQCHGGE